MKSLIVVIAMFFSIVSYAEMVTSTVEGTISYLPVKGQVIKKGEVLMKCSETSIDYSIEGKKLEIELAKDVLDDMKSDFARCVKLLKSKSVSIAAYEDSKVLFSTAKIKMARLEYELKQMAFEKEQHIIKAPYNCKVTEVIIAINSGIGIGDDVLNVQRLDE